MEPSFRCKEWRPWSHPHPHQPHHHFHHHPHHHHHHHLLLHCPHHHLHHHHFNHPSFAPLPPQKPVPVPAAPLQNNLKLDATGFNEAYNSTTQMFPEEHEVLEEGEDDDPIFVLTDEWREFFAKSEAKRKLEKKQAKKKLKN